MTTSLEVAIVDDEWPKLRLVCTRRSTSGEAVVSSKSVLYDQAAVQFESQLQNHLRVMVADIIFRKKNPQQFHNV